MEAKLNQDNLEDLDSFVLWQGFDKYWEEFEITKDESLLEFCLAYCKTLSNRSDTDAMVALGDIYHGASVDRVIYGGGHLESFYIPKCRYRDYKSAAYWYE
ncbi:MAG: hypothetical protein GX626_09420, partial [Spirochaetales bacterium]|nr:hypothetical protein [Spirochaetales bacterium]